MDDSLGTDGDGNNMTLADILPGNDGDIADTVSDNIEARRLYIIMKKTLTPMEYTIMRKRYGLCGTPQLTQQQIADLLGISRSYVSRIEKKCLTKLSNAFGKAVY